MYITQQILDKIEQKYGQPQTYHTTCAMNKIEFDLLKWSMRKGRAHDITPFVFHNSNVAVIRKPSYPEEIYRPPSGGIEPGEDFESGIKREIYEETGLHIKIEKYVLKTYVDFYFEDQVVNWITHVFTAKATTNDINPIDQQEISDARWATIEELETTLLSSLRQSTSAGLRYRAEIQSATLEIINTTTIRKKKSVQSTIEYP
ncbi:hypothetical protein CMK22_19705 [Candidatus Poribacteria bacterium]|nr:hypothetical protein [Candidatus Poribacteria bacterium]